MLNFAIDVERRIIRIWHMRLKDRCEDRGVAILLHIVQRFRLFHQVPIGQAGQNLHAIPCAHRMHRVYRAKHLRILHAKADRTIPTHKVTRYPT